MVSKARRFLKKNALTIPAYSLMVIGMFSLISMASQFVNESKYVDAETLNNTPAVVQDIYELEQAESFDDYEEQDELEQTPEYLIMMACNYYEIEYKIPLAIAKLETGHFTSRAFKEGNNVGGMSVNEVPIEYDSLKVGVDAFVKNLAQNYFEKGLTSVESISEKYCPVNAESWSRTVNQLIEEIK